MTIIMGEEKAGLAKCFGCDEVVAWQRGNVYRERGRLGVGERGSRRERERERERVGERDISIN